LKALKVKHLSVKNKSNIIINRKTENRRLVEFDNGMAITSQILSSNDFDHKCVKIRKNTGRCGWNHQNG